MAKSPSHVSAAIEVVDDSEEEQSKRTKKKDASDAESTKAGEEGDDAGSEVEEEYEIEAILDARHGAFPGGRTGYLVKWKGYSEEHNSWVDQQDAIGAADMIEEYWQKVQKSKRGKTKGAKARPRKSDGKADSLDADEPSSTSKRKKSASGGRKSKSLQPEEDQPMEEDEEDKPTVKKAKRTPKETKDEMDVDVREADDGSEYHPMDTTKHREKSWEKLVLRVDTIEKTDGSLRVFFTLNNGDKIVGNSRECAKYFPQKLIQFYESNLRWRESEA